MCFLSLRFEDMPERHAELAWRFGEPDDCVVNTDPSVNNASGRWSLASPLPTDTALAGHLTWVSELLRPHEDFVGELVSLGGKVVLHLRCETSDSEPFFRFDARLLLPLAHTGVLIEVSVGPAR